VTTGADSGMRLRLARQTRGFSQHPLAAERFDLVIPVGHAGSREVQALLKVLFSRWLLDQLASLPGYDSGRCGEHIATLPPLPDATRNVK
jgi:molybdate-binding protein